MRWFRKGPSPHQTALAMIGAKQAGQVLVIGAGDGALAAELALVTGLNGRTLVVDRTDDAKTRIDLAAARAGALVDHENAPATMLPLDTGTFDVAVINSVLDDAPAAAAQIIGEAARVIRGGGRVVIINGAPRPGVLGLVGRARAPQLESRIVRDLLTAAGLFGVRVLAESEGVMFVEGTKGKALAF